MRAFGKGAACKGYGRKNRHNRQPNKFETWLNVTKGNGKGREIKRKPLLRKDEQELNC